MEATHSGVTGRLVVAKHVEEEFRLVLGLVPIPRWQTEDEIAADWDLINNHVNVTDVPAQVKLSYITQTKHEGNICIRQRHWGRRRLLSISLDLLDSFI